MKTSKFLLALTIGILSHTMLSAQSPGDIAFTGFNADGSSSDGFSFYVINDIPANTTIYFTDNDWEGTAFTTNEGAVEWSHTAIVPAGTTIIIDNYVGGAAEATLGSATEVDLGMDISATNDAIYAYLGSLGSPTTFLGAIGNNTSAGSDYNLTGTGLVEGETAISIGGDNDVMVMTADLSGSCPGSSCADEIYDAMNWMLDNGGGDQSGNGGGTADFPMSVSDPETGTPLPVELVAFSVNDHKDGAMLNWSTASEIDNDFFLVERSVDGGGNYETIAKVRGSGTTNAYTEYAYIDNNISGSYKTYYRLKQVDFDGAFEYSSVVEKSMDLNESQIAVFPNPFEDQLYVKATVQGDINIMMYDHGARIIYTKQHLASGGDSIEISLPRNLKSGVYHMKITSDAGVVLKRVVKR